VTSATPTSSAASHSTTTTSRPHRTTTTIGHQVTTTLVPSVTTTTPGSPSNSLGAAQASYGSNKGEAAVASIGNVVNDGSGHLSFIVNLRNAGTLPYNCDALKAEARTAHGSTPILGPLTGTSGVPCPGPEDTLAPGGNETFAFYIPVTGGAAREVVVLPFGSYASRLVWSLSGT
jgi:hypothetical protein